MNAAEVALGAGVVLSLAASGFLGWRLNRLERRSRRVAHSEPVPTGPSSLQHVGVVRFNPYHDTGGDYSFAVALLDASGSGVLLTGMYHRDQCRVYAKQVRGWDSEYTLSGEEREAIEQARGENPLRPREQDRI